MDNLPVISEVTETTDEALSSSGDETIDQDSIEETSSQAAEIRADSPLHYADCEDTGHCENCRKNSHHSHSGDEEDCRSISSSCMGEDVCMTMEELTVGRGGLLLDNFLTLRRDSNLRTQSLRKDKRLSMVIAAGLDPGKPPAVISRSMETLVVSSLGEPVSIFPMQLNLFQIGCILYLQV